MRFFVSPPASLGFFNFTTLLSTWFGFGLLRPAPGTWGSVMALPFAWGILVWAGWPLLLSASLLLLWIGIHQSERFAEASGDSDPSSVVVDEAVGMWLALLAVPMTWTGFALAFILFRFFDIVKPWPVSWADRELKGGLGIMLDDVIAGVYSTVVILGLIFLGWL